MGKLLHPCAGGWEDCSKGILLSMKQETEYLGSSQNLLQEKPKADGFFHCYFLKLLCDLSLDTHFVPDLTLIQQEVDALEELSRQLFLETADLYATKVKGKETKVWFLPV